MAATGWGRNPDRGIKQTQREIITEENCRLWWISRPIFLCLSMKKAPVFFSGASALIGRFVIAQGCQEVSRRLVSIPYRKVRNMIILQSTSTIRVSIPYRKVRNQFYFLEEAWLWFQSLIGRFVIGTYTWSNRARRFQSLIGRFVILNAPHHYYIADFNTLAEITQYFTSQTHKLLWTLRAYIILRESTSAKTQFFTPWKWLWSNCKISQNIKSYCNRIYHHKKV